MFSLWFLLFLCVLMAGACAALWRRNAKLREQGERVTLALSATEAGTWMFYRDGRRLVVDEQYTRMMGETRTDVIRSPDDVYERMHPDDRERVRAVYRSLLAGDIAMSEVEFRLRHAQGHWSWVLSRSRVGGRDVAGLPTVVAGIHLDITARKGVEQQLMLERELLTGVIEGTQVGTWRWNIETGEQEVNAIWAQVLGHELADFTPMRIDRWRELIHPADLAPVNRLLEQHFQGETPYYEAEFRMRHRLGHWVWIHARGKLIGGGASTRPVWMVGTHTDVSARKLVESELVSANERFRLAARSASIGVWEIDTETGDVVWNQQMRDHFAIHEDVSSDVLRRLWRERVHPDRKSVV